MFKKRLRLARMKKKFTQQSVADTIDVSLNAYQKYEQGERFPPQDTLVKLADLFDTSIDYLLGRDSYLESLGVSVDEFQ